VCFKSNVVSSESLQREYDFDVIANIEKIKGKVYFFHHNFSTRFAATYITDNPLDFNHPFHKRLGFFWKPHLEKMFDLEAGRLALKCPSRRAAAARLTGKVRALYVRLLIGQRGKDTSRSLSHKFYVSAESKPKGGFWTEKPLTAEERALIAAHIPVCNHREALLQQESDARRLLQQSFLNFRGDLRVCSAKDPVSVAEAIKMSEATRHEYLCRLQTKSFYDISHRFRQWQDLPLEL